MKEKKETPVWLVLLVLGFVLFTMANINKMEREFDKRYLNQHEQGTKN